MGAHYSHHDRFRRGYNMGYRQPYYDRSFPAHYEPTCDYDLDPVVYRQQPFYDGFRRDYRRGGTYDDRYGVVPMEEVFRRVDSPHWMDRSRNSHYGGGQWDGYRSDRYDHHGGGGYRLDRYDHHGGGELGGYRLDRYDHHGGGQLGGYRLDRYDHHGGGQLGGYRLDRYDHHGGGHDVVADHDGHSLSRTAVELYVPVCCDKCERKLRKHLAYAQGVETVTVDQTTKKVVVFGHVNPSHVLNLARQDKPESDFWNSIYDNSL